MYYLFWNGLHRYKNHYKTGVASSKQQSKPLFLTTVQHIIIHYTYVGHEQLLINYGDKPKNQHLETKHDIFYNNNFVTREFQNKEKLTGLSLPESKHLTWVRRRSQSDMSSMTMTYGYLNGQVAESSIFNWSKSLIPPIKSKTSLFNPLNRQILKRQP